MCPFGSPDATELPGNYAFDGPIYNIYALRRINGDWKVAEARLLGEDPPPRNACICIPVDLTNQPPSDE